MEALEWLQSVMNGDLPPPPIVAALEMRPEEIDSGRVVFSMPAREWMCNPSGVVHGGMAATLLDTVLSLAVVSKLPKGKTCQTVQMNLNYVRPLLPTGERVTAEGIAVHAGTTLGTAEARLHDSRGRLIAHGTATLAILDADAALPRSLPDS